MITMIAMSTKYDLESVIVTIAVIVSIALNAVGSLQ